MILNSNSDKKVTEFNDNGLEEVSRFNFNLNPSSDLLSSSNTARDSRRSSIFRDKDNFLTHIAENEEFFSNDCNQEDYSDEEEKKY
jgi:hypothetical protein